MDGMIIYTLPIIGALIGWLTNYLAVKMLFHPREKKKILFFELQGIFPTKQPILAKKVGKIYAEELLTIEDIQKIINNPNTFSKISKSIDDEIQKYLEWDFPIEYPVLSLFMGEKAKLEIKQAFLNKINNMMPEVINKTVSNLKDSLNIEDLITQKVNAFSKKKMEDMVFGILEGEFRFIELVGAILGFLIGLMQIFILNFMT